MSIALTRSDLIAHRDAMPKGARGRKAFQPLIEQMTTADLRFEAEIDAALMAGLSRDPEWKEAR